MGELSGRIKVVQGSCAAYARSKGSAPRTFTCCACRACEYYLRHLTLPDIYHRGSRPIAFLSMLALQNVYRKDLLLLKRPRGTLQVLSLVRGLRKFARYDK